MTLIRPLSPRESAVIAALGANMSYREAAAIMNVKVITVRKLAAAVMWKLPLEYRHPAGPRATIRRYCDSLKE